MLFMPFMVECTISVVSFGECHPAVQMLLRDQREDVFEFRKSCFAGIHKGVAASESRDFSLDTAVLRRRHASPRDAYGARGSLGRTGHVNA